MNKRTFSIVFCLGVFLPLLCRTKESAQVDSLKNALRKNIAERQGTLTDTVELYTVNALLNDCYYQVPETAMYYAKEILTLSEKLHFKKGVARGHFLIGRMLMDAGDYTQSLTHFENSLNIRLK